MEEKTDIVKKEATSQEATGRMQTARPMVDIYENENEILLHADMPGVSKEDVSVNIDNGTLLLSGVRRVETAGTANWEEFGPVEYKRTFSVPQTIELGKVNAELKDGVLQLHLPKSEAAKPKQIEIIAA